MTQNQGDATSMTVPSVPGDVSPTVMDIKSEPADSRFARSPGPAPPSPSVSPRGLEPHFGEAGAQAGAQVGDEDGDDGLEWDPRWDLGFERQTVPAVPAIPAVRAVRVLGLAQLARDHAKEVAMMKSESAWLQTEVQLLKAVIAKAVIAKHYTLGPELPIPGPQHVEEIGTMREELLRLRAEFEALHALKAKIERPQAEASSSVPQVGSSSHPIDADNRVLNPTIDNDDASVIATPNDGSLLYCICDEDTAFLPCGPHCYIGIAADSSATTNIVGPPQGIVTQQPNNTALLTTLPVALLTFHTIVAPLWLSEAMAFLWKIPKDAMGWLSVVPDNQRVFEICFDTSLWRGEAKHCDEEGVNWPAVFLDCERRLANIVDEGVRRIFTQVILVTCSLAMANGCPRRFARDTVRAVLTANGADAWDLTNADVDQVLKAAIMALPFYRETARVLGSKAYEIALHVDIIPLVETMDLPCLGYIFHHYRTAIPRPEGFYAEFDSELLSIPSLVCNMMNSTSEGKIWTWDDITEAFRRQWCLFYDGDYRRYIDCESY